MLRWFMEVGDEGTCGSPPCDQSSSSSSSSSAYRCIYRFAATYNCTTHVWAYDLNSHGTPSIGLICELPTNPLYMPQGSWILTPGATDCKQHYFLLGPSCPAHEVTTGCPILSPGDYPAFPASPPSSCCPPSSSSTTSSSSSAVSSSSSGSGPVPCSCPGDVQPTYTLHIDAGTMTDPTGHVYAWDAQDIAVTATGTTACQWATVTSPFSFTVDGTPNTTDMTLQLLSSAASDGCVDSGCFWLIYCNPAHLEWVSFTGALPEDGLYSQIPCHMIHAPAGPGNVYTVNSGTATVS